MGKVEIKQHGRVEPGQDLLQWPSGEMILDVLQEDPGVFLASKDPSYWQASARWALLKKFDLFDESNAVQKSLSQRKPTSSGDGSPRHLVFSDAELEAIQSRWEQLVRQPPISEGSEDIAAFMQSGGKSNDRVLQWSTMDCPPGTQFRLHAHPNVELIYCARGELHEIRMNGQPQTKTFEPIGENDEDDGRVKGPNLVALDRPWHFATLRAGDWLVNEVGSIHKSFTASNGNGCLLMVLWGGSHADIVPGEEPKLVDVHKAVDRMDEKLAHCDCSNWESLEETFLPESERSKGAV